MQYFVISASIHLPIPTFGRFLLEFFFSISCKIITATIKLSLLIQISSNGTVHHMMVRCCSHPPHSSHMLWNGCTLLALFNLWNNNINKKSLSIVSYSLCRLWLVAYMFFSIIISLMVLDCISWWEWVFKCITKLVNSWEHVGLYICVIAVRLAVVGVAAAQVYFWYGE